MKILSLDLGSTLGWASGVGGKPKKHGTKDFQRPVQKDSQETAFSNESFAEFTQWLGKRISSVDIVVCEKPNVYGTGKFSSFHAMRVLFGMYGIVQAVAGAYGKSLIPVSATTVKKFWTGNGRANKNEMLVLAAERGFSSVKDHNECDAIAIYTYYWEILRAQGKTEDKEDLLIETPASFECGSDGGDPATESQGV